MPVLWVKVRSESEYDLIKQGFFNVLTARIRRMGKVMFSQACVCPQRGRGYCALWSQVLYQIGGVPLDRTGVPSLPRQGRSGSSSPLPQAGTEGIPPSPPQAGQGIPLPPSVPDRIGVPLPPRTGVPLLPDRTGVPLHHPPRQDRVPLPLPPLRTGYAVGGTPLAVTQEDFLVYCQITGAHLPKLPWATG